MAELSKFGQCVVDTVTANEMAKVPVADVSSELKEAVRKSIRQNIGEMAVHDPQHVVEHCAPSLPKNVSLQELHDPHNRTGRLFGPANSAHSHHGLAKPPQGHGR